MKTILNRKREHINAYANCFIWLFRSYFQVKRVKTWKQPFQWLFHQMCLHLNHFKCITIHKYIYMYIVKCLESKKHSVSCMYIEIIK